MPKKKFDFQSYVVEGLEKAGAEKLKDNYYLINGWRVRITNRGIYWHSRIVDEFDTTFAGLSKHWEDKAGKPFTSRLQASESVVSRFVAGVIKFKTRQLLKREAKEQAKAERIANRRLSKQPWCKGCTFSPQGEASKKCDSMAFSEEYGINYCKDSRFYETYWCDKAKLEKGANDTEVFQGKFRCSETGELCPYQRTSSVGHRHYISYDSNDEHFTSCPMYEGDRETITFKPLKLGGVAIA